MASETAFTGLTTFANQFSRLGVVGTITGMILFHQAAVELFKFLSRSKARHYYDALVYIVYGPSEEPLRTKTSRVFRSLFYKSALTPVRVQQEVQKRQPRSADTEQAPPPTSWAEGVEGRLIDSFLLRSVGDDPVGEISDRDVENVARITRFVATEEVRRTIELLDILIARGTNDPNAAIDALQEIAATGEVKKRIEGWITALRNAVSPVPVGALLEADRLEFVEHHLPGELRARVELGNAFRAAEYRFHRTLSRFSFALALGEALWIAASLRKAAAAQVAAAAQAIPEVGSGLVIATFVIAFGTLVVAPPASKSLLQVIQGIGQRSKA